MEKDIACSRMARCVAKSEPCPLPQKSDRLRQSLHGQCVEVLLDRFRGILQAGTVLCDRFEDGRLIAVEQGSHEHIGVLGLDTKRREPIGWKVGQVLGDDEIGAASNGGGQHMAIVRVRKIERFDERLVAGDQATSHVRIHHRARAVKIYFQRGALAQYGADPFIMNSIRPPRAEEIGEGEPHEHIPQRRGIQHTGIVQHCDGRHSLVWHSVAQPKFLSLLGQFLEDIAPRPVLLLFVGHEIRVEDAAVRADLAEREFSVFEQADQKWS